jgi:hypothetical protein
MIRWLPVHWTRWTIFLVFTFLCLVLGENYPFSNFPMYSDFTPRSYYIYLADAEGRAVATTRFGLTTPRLKKIFESHRRKSARSNDQLRRDPAATDRSAGLALLDHLEKLPAVQRQPPKLRRGLQVRRVNLFWRAGRIEAATHTIARRD